MRHVKTGVRLALLLAVAAICVSAQIDPGAAVAMKEKDDRYRIGFQDQLTIQVFNHPNLEQRVSVLPNGTINLYRLNHPVKAVCKTETELAADIRKAYMENYLRDPEVRVTADQKSQPVSVIGAVEKPNTYFITRKMHLLEVLALAGGPNKEAGTRVILFRGGGSNNCKETGLDENVSVMEFKMRDLQEGKKIVYMQADDVVSVLDADIIYVYGNVNQQGAFAIKDRITLTQAIAKAEGLKPATKRDKVRVLRQKGDTGEREEIIYDLALIDKGKAKDPFLEPSDIVAVSEDKTKAILLSVGDAFKKGIPGIIYRVPVP